MHFADPFRGNHDVKWENAIVSFDGLPFFIIGREILDCHHGKERKASAKRRSASEVSRKKLLFHLLSVYGG